MPLRKRGSIMKRSLRINPGSRQLFPDRHQAILGPRAPKDKKKKKSSYFLRHVKFGRIWILGFRLWPSLYVKPLKVKI